MSYTFDTTILNGFPVTIEFFTTGYDNRDVGCGIDDIEDWHIVAVDGVRCKQAPTWLYTRIGNSPDEASEIEYKCAKYYEECNE